MKPTRGRLPTGPDFGEIWHGAVVEHVVCRSVRDSAAILDATAGPDAGAPYAAPEPARPFREEVGREPGRLRIAFTDRPWLGHEVDAECAAALRDTAQLLEGLGHAVEEASPAFDGPGFARAFLTMICGELRCDIEEAETVLGRRATGADFESATWALGLLGRATPAAAFARAIRSLERTAREIAPFFDRHDVLLTPTVSRPPVPTGALQPRPAERRLLGLLGGIGSGRLLRVARLLEQTADKVFDFIPWTPVINATGQPAMSVPLGWSREGLPLGMHFVGRYGDEATLYRLAAQLEAARPWANRWPAAAT
jgi:amidase